MAKVTMQSTLSVVSLGTPADREATTTSRACIEQVSSGRWMAHAVISPVDLGPFATEADAAQAMVNALDLLAFRIGEAYAPPAVVEVVEVKAAPAPAPAPVASSSLVEATTTIASAHTATGPTVPTEVRPVVIEDTGHAPVAPVAVGPLGHPIG